MQSSFQSLHFNIKYIWYKSNFSVQYALISNVVLHKLGGHNNILYTIFLYFINQNNVYFFMTQHTNILLKEIS